MRSHQKRGSVALKVALMLPVLLGFGAISIDFGMLLSAKTKLQHVADAGALAGLSALDLGPEMVTNRAQFTMAENHVLGHSALIPDSGIKIGHFSRYSSPNFVLDETEGDTVRIYAEMGNIPLFLAPILGFETASVSAVSIAGTRFDVGGPPAYCLMSAESFIFLGAGVQVDVFDSILCSESDGIEPHLDGGLCSNNEIDLGDGVYVGGNVSNALEGNWDVSGSAQIEGIDYPLESLLDISSAPLTYISGLFDTFFTLAFPQNMLLLANPLPPSQQPYDPTTASFILDPGVSYTMPGGLYAFSSFFMGPGSQLSFSGPVEIFVNTDMGVDQGQLLSSIDNPSDVQFWVNGNVIINSSTPFSALIAAPESTVILQGGGSYIGAFTANNIEVLDGSSVHLDACLQETLLPGEDTSTLEPNPAILF